MVRIKQDPPKQLSQEETARLKALYAEEDRILDWLLEHCSDDPNFNTMIRRLHENDVKILELEGGKALEVNEDFR